MQNADAHTFSAPNSQIGKPAMALTEQSRCANLAVAVREDKVGVKCMNSLSVRQAGERDGGRTVSDSMYRARLKGFGQVA